jgi:hypothetical protein
MPEAIEKRGKLSQLILTKLLKLADDADRFTY